MEEGWRKWRSNLALTPFPRGRDDQELAEEPSSRSTRAFPKRKPRAPIRRTLGFRFQTNLQ